MFLHAFDGLDLEKQQQLPLRMNRPRLGAARVFGGVHPQNHKPGSWPLPLAARLL